jgi:hypothetical protein
MLIELEAGNVSLFGPGLCHDAGQQMASGFLRYFSRLNRGCDHSFAILGGARKALPQMQERR